MAKKTTILAIVTWWCLAATTMNGQSAVAHSFGGLIPTMPSVMSPVLSGATPSTDIAKNRARTLGRRVSGSGTKYLTLTGKDVAGKSPDEILKMLAPITVNIRDGVKHVEYVIDLEQAPPMTLMGKPGKAIDLGSVVVKGLGTSAIDVNTTILTNGLTVIAR